MCLRLRAPSNPTGRPPMDGYSVLQIDALVLLERTPELDTGTAFGPLVLDGVPLFPRR